MGYYIKDISEEVICPRNRSVRYPKLQIFVKMDKLWSTSAVPQADQAMVLLMICNGRSRFDSNDRIMPHKSLNLRSFVPKLQ